MNEEPRMAKFKFPVKQRLEIAYRDHGSIEPTTLMVLKFDVIVEQCEKVSHGFDSEGLLEKIDDRHTEVSRLMVAIQVGFGIMGLWEARIPIDMYERHCGGEMADYDQAKIYRQFFLSHLTKSR